MQSSWSTTRNCSSDLPWFGLQYSKRYLEQLLPSAKVIPAVNQIENHPSLPQDEIVDLCKAKGIHVMAYSPFGSTGAPVMTADPVVKAAQKHGVAAGTILLSYHRRCFSGSRLLGCGL